MWPVGTKVNRGAGVTRFLVVLVAMAGLGYGVIAFTGGASAGTALRDASETTTPVTSSPSTAVSAPNQPADVPAAQEVLPANDALTPDPALLSRGDTGRKVRMLQARLRQLGWYAGEVRARYGARTTRAVEGFQAKHKLPVTGDVDLTTMERLRAITRRPTRDELANRVVFGGQGGGGTWTTAPLDRRCRVGHVLCVDKSSRTIRWVVDGEVRKTMAVRFGAAYTPTREGVFHVGWKSRDHVSKLYDSSMPFAMFFSGGQAVHYSSDFAAKGYSGASHGCVNVRDYAGIKWLFDQVDVGDKVVIFWS
jgi:peptidoglycan hydrolase-like protein with peptidoglycan-binding domain